MNPFSATARLLALVCFTLLTTACMTSNQTTADQGKTRQIEKIGVQLYTIREQMAADFEGSLRKIAALGYDEVEFAGLYGRDPADVRKLLADLSLDPVASHINSVELRRDPAAMIAQTKAIGARYMVIAWFPPEDRDTLSEWKEWIALFNKIGAMAKQEGIQFVYHNHEFEFIPIDGVRPYDLLLEQLDPGLVRMELDLYWLELAGVDPLPLFAKYPGRFPLLHVKDMSRQDSSMADVGAGRIDFATIFADRERSGTRHYFVEHDSTSDPFASLANSISYLRNLRF